MERQITLTLSQVLILCALVVGFVLGVAARQRTVIVESSHDNRSGSGGFLIVAAIIAVALIFGRTA